jgi:multiple antibiotic resistance protein
MWHSIAINVSRMLASALLIVAALFPIVNPLGSAPIFLSLTPGYSHSDRAVLSSKIAMNSFFLLVGSILIGTHILDFFGISLPIVQVAGGLVILATGWSLLNRRDHTGHSEKVETITPAEIAQRAFYPLTLPLTVGPGSISVAITLGANADKHQHGFPFLLVPALLGPAVIALSVYFAYRYSEALARLLGEVAMSVIVRLSSFILFCIGVQILWNGCKVLLATVRPR